MTERSPPFSALRALEAACRHKSYTMAGEELRVTHSAVSQAIRRLEEAVKSKLFYRQGLSMEPTPAALDLARAYHEAERLVDSALGDVSSRSAPDRLTISLMPSMARLWLAWRMPKLNAAMGEVAVEVRTSRDLANFETDGVDAAIRIARVPSPKLRSLTLFRERVFPVCTPEFAAIHALQEPADLARAPLIIPDDTPWSQWFEAAGVTLEREPRGVTVDDAGVAVEIACAGLGAALVRWDHVQRDVEAGRLIIPFDIRVPTGKSCYFVWREGAPRERGVKQFLRWLIDEGRDGGLCEPGEFMDTIDARAAA